MSSAIIYAIIYFIIVVGGSWFYFRGKIKDMEDFTKGGQRMGWVMIAASMSLIPLGSGHTMNLWEASAGLGASVLFWPVIVGGIFLPILMLWLGPWIRDLKVTTFPESMELQFGKGMGYLHGCVSVASWTGIIMAETIVAGSAIYGLTGGQIPLTPWCIIIAFLLILCYVIFGGILQFSLVSLVNATVMIVGSYLAMFMVGGWIVANLNGWQGVIDFYQSSPMGLGHLKMFSFSPDLLFKVVIPVTVLHVTAAAVTQGMYIPLQGGKSNQEVRKGVFLAAGINGISSFPWVIMALIAMTMGGILGLDALGDQAAKLSVIKLAMHTLPSPVVGLLMVCLLAATLSTGSSIIMGNATIITDLILKRAMFPKMTSRTQLSLMRPMIIVCGLLACIPAIWAPMLFPVFLWCFSFGIPIFIVWLIGMVWKCSAPAAWITVLVTYFVNFYWTFWTPAWAPGPFGLNMYPVTVVAIVLGIVLNLILPGDEPLLKRMKIEA